MNLRARHLTVATGRERIRSARNRITGGIPSLATSFLMVGRGKDVSALSAVWTGVFLFVTTASLTAGRLAQRSDSPTTLKTSLGLAGSSTNVRT